MSALTFAMGFIVGVVSAPLLIVVVLSFISAAVAEHRDDR